jgi:hypothetical protein
MKKPDDYPDDRKLLLRGILIMGGGALFAHVLFPFIWWNFMGGSQYQGVPQSMPGLPTNYRVVTYTPLPVPTLTATPTASPTVTSTPTITATVEAEAQNRQPAPLAAPASLAGREGGQQPAPPRPSPIPGRGGIW